MVLTDFPIGPEPKYQKPLPDVWGIGTIPDVTRLPAEWQATFGTSRAGSRRSIR
jgi:hypothetical protein